MDKIIIGTRGSDLALWQANHIKKALLKQGYQVELKIIKTQGDIIQHLSFDKMEGKGFFTKELEQALLNKEIDLAVHSHKDLETSLPEGLTIAAVTQRANPCDVLIINKESYDIKEPYCLKKNAVLGTSSVRRKAQFRAIRNDVIIEDLRGNVPTRIQKLREKKYDAIMLAKAGIERLQINLQEFETLELSPKEFIPAPAQGVLALQTRTDSADLIKALQILNDRDIQNCIYAERKILNMLQGGCRLPMGAYCVFKDGIYMLWASFLSAENNLPKRIYITGTFPEKIAEQACYKLLNHQKLSVFISRKEKDSKYFFRSLGEYGCLISGNSLTRYEAIPFSQNIPYTDWIFFSSKNCVKYFYAQQPLVNKKTKIGSIGGATAEALKKLGIKPDFTGRSNDTEEIGKEFAIIAGECSVLFPQSTASFRTIQKQFTSQKKLIDLIVYDTLPNEDIQLIKTDVAVLTSPTNALLYIRNIKPVDYPKHFIVIGKSTARILEENGIDNYTIAWNTSELALTDMVMSL
jgi:hydroxymethylbilane synthase